MKAKFNIKYTDAIALTDTEKEAIFYFDENGVQQGGYYVSTDAPPKYPLETVELVVISTVEMIELLKKDPRFNFIEILEE